MRARYGRSTLLAGAAVAATGLIAGCGSSASQKKSGPPPGGTTTKAAVPPIHVEAVVPGQTLSIYTSFALQGRNAPTNDSVNNAIRLALEQIHGRIDGHLVRLVLMDNSTAASGGPDPATVAEDAYQAANDPTTIAYIGEDASGATAVSLPILNRAGILQVSPLSTSDALTLGGTTPATSLATLYPTRHRTFGRVIPDDALQAVAQANYQSQQGCNRVYLVNDGTVYGTGIAAGVSKTDATVGISTAGASTISPDLRNFSKLVNAVNGSGANCLFYGGELNPNTSQMWKTLVASDSSLKMFGPDGVAVNQFADELGSDPTLDANTFLTSPGLGPNAYNNLGQQFFETYEARWGQFPDPSAIFGYEAMEAILSSIQAAGPAGNNRAAVIAQFFAIRNRQSVIGTYSIDHNGDSTLDAYGGYVIDQGQLTFDHTLATAGGSS